MIRLRGLTFRGRILKQAYYDVSDAALRLAPQTPSVNVRVQMVYGGVGLEMSQVVLAPEGSGDVDRPMTTVPSLSVAISPSGGDYSAYGEEFYGECAGSWG